MSTAKPFYVSSEDAPAKQKIVIAALHLFVRDGLCETSVRDIAAASGFTNPALFKHFASKDHLAAYLFERCYVELFSVVANAIRTGKTFTEKHRAAIRAYMAVLDHEPDAALYVQEHLRHFWPKMPARVRKHSILSEVRSLLENGRSEGVVTKQIDVGLLTTAWVGTLNQFARARFFGDFSQEPAEIEAALEKLLLRMLAATVSRNAKL